MINSNAHGELIFADYPSFKPNLSPRDIFTRGSFGGTYWRKIDSTVTNKTHKYRHKKYIWLSDLDNKIMTVPWDKYDVSINRYKQKVGTTLEFWESKKWIKKSHPYGWVQWYCDFCMGERSDDDERQIDRWNKTAGPNSRFRRRLINMVLNRDAKYDDISISPKIRQTLQHWGYVLTKRDCIPKPKTTKKNVKSGKNPTLLEFGRHYYIY